MSELVCTIPDFNIWCFVLVSLFCFVFVLYRGLFFFFSLKSFTVLNIVYSKYSNEMVLEPSVPAIL